MLLTVVVAFFIHWWMIFVAVVALLLSYSIAGAFMPRKLNFYLTRIISSLHNRQADYAKANDHMRAEAAGEIVKLLEDYAAEVLLLDLPVPVVKGTKTAELKNDELQ